MNKVLSLIFKLKDSIRSVIVLGTQGCVSSEDNRITILSNIIALFSAATSLYVYFQIVAWDIHEKLLFSYLLIPVIALLVISLNALKKTIAARIVTNLTINLVAWNALVFFGKSFNGYLLFYAAIVYSVIAFHGMRSITRWSTLGFSILGLPIADYLTHKSIVPITNFHSSQAPISFLYIDTAILISLIVIMLLIEKYLSEENETALTKLNSDLEQIVEKRTALLNDAKEGAMAASRAKSQFVANTSHELRTPLGAIIGFVDLILSAKPSEEEKTEYLRAIQRNANQLSQIVNEVLDLSKIEAEKLQIENEIFALDDLIEDLRLLMTLKAEDKGLTFAIEKADHIPNQIYTDPLRLKQILINLTGNAIKFTEEGAVKVKVDFEETSNGQFLIFDIHDTGPGISSEAQKSLFQPFSQGDGTLMRKHGGTGLGLSLSKNLAQLLGGEIKLLGSEIKKGSTFRLKIKCIATYNKVERNVFHVADLTTNALKNRNILVVDDARDNQFLINRYLTLSGAEVVVTENGLEALKMMKLHTDFDLILMDLQMPVMDGYEATRILREQGCKIPIVALTAHAMVEEKSKSKLAGFSSYLTKPIHRQRLITTLVELTK